LKSEVLKLDNLVIANIQHRPARVFATAAGISIGTVLILLIVGLAHGTLKERGARESNVAAEILVRPAGTFTIGLSANLLSMSVDTADKIRLLPGVKSVTPVGQYVQSTDGAFGFRAIDAIDFDSYQATCGIRLVSGQAPNNDGEVIVDENYANDHKIK